MRRAEIDVAAAAMSISDSLTVKMCEGDSNESNLDPNAPKECDSANLTARPPGKMKGESNKGDERALSVSDRVLTGDDTNGLHEEAVEDILNLVSATTTD